MPGRIMVVADRVAGLAGRVTAWPLPRAHCVPCRAPYRRAGCCVACLPCCIVALPAPYRSHVVAVSPGVSRHTPVSKPSSCYDTKLCIATLTPSGQAHARAPLDLCLGRPAVSWGLSVVSWSSCGHVVGVAWPYRCPLAAPSVLLCHDTVCCMLTKPGNWAVAHSSSCNFFFSTSFFFHFFPPTKRP